MCMDRSHCKQNMPAALTRALTSGLPTTANEQPPCINQ